MHWLAGDYWKNGRTGKVGVRPYSEECVIGVSFFIFLFLSLFFPSWFLFCLQNSYCGFLLVISENCSLFISLMCFFFFTFPHVAVSNMGGCKSHSINKGNIHKRSSTVCTIQIRVCVCFFFSELYGQIQHLCKVGAILWNSAGEGVVFLLRHFHRCCPHDMSWQNFKSNVDFTLIHRHSTQF